MFKNINLKSLLKILDNPLPVLYVKTHSYNGAYFPNQMEILRNFEKKLESTPGLKKLMENRERFPKSLRLALASKRSRIRNKHKKILLTS